MEENLMPPYEFKLTIFADTLQDSNTFFCEEENMPTRMLSAV